MRRPLIAGNWKMFKTNPDTSVFLAEFLPKLSDVPSGRDVLLCPPFLSIARAVGLAAGTPLCVGAQNVYPKENGAFTGEVSPLMLVDAGVKYCLVGHSERRAYFGEVDTFLNEKVRALLEVGITPIVCVGETLEQREAGQAESVVAEQVRAGLTGVAITSVVVAYEPVWAIGTGKTASAADAQQMHASIRTVLAALGEAELVRILYGGSVKADNIAELMAMPDIDGALVGGASLDPSSFYAICNYVEKG
ncbi:triose-phosphate isomerase [Chrysiogenes arsenatis]|uniref:triose-phosphate isomerase n=1 Tax=Chrysiogenes arsenatis TaxID=309797 RepID=UPI000483CEB5|nr:triose-phosphate isomerase [Chrysiogenes arsenatis]